MSRLTIVSKEESDAPYELAKEPVTLGRGHDCAIRLEDPLISRHHARVFRSEGKWWIEDLGSRNRTFVNGQELVSPHLLRHDDRIEIGGITLFFEGDMELLNQTWTNEPVLSSAAAEETHFEHSVEPTLFREEAFDSHSLEILYRTASLLSGTTGLAVLSRVALTEIRSFFKADTACLFLSDRVKPPIQPVLVLSDDPSPMVSQTVVVYSIQSRRAACIRDTQSELPAGDVLNMMGGGKSRSLMCAPLVMGEKVFGAILVDRVGKNAFDHRSLVLFTAVAHLVGNGIYQRQQIEKLEETAHGAGSDPGVIEALVGSSRAIEQLRQRIAQVAEADEPVLIVGEPGSGRHEVARTIHFKSPRSGGPLVWLHALAEPAERIAEMLFGVEETGAQSANTPRQGKLEMANGGTIVIEEIGALPSAVQSSLLAYLKTLKVTRTGGQRRYFTDTRLIATTSEALEDTVATGKFSIELFGAIATQTIAVPTLRERGDDAIELARRFVNLLAPLTGRRELLLAPPVVRALCAYRWPGNVRELRNVVEYAVLRSRGGEITVANLPGELVAYVQQQVQATVADGA
jgi:DNA-binding NtrC family response regulator